MEQRDFEKAKKIGLILAFIALVSALPIGFVACNTQSGEQTSETTIAIPEINSIDDIKTYDLYTRSTQLVADYLKIAPAKLKGSEKDYLNCNTDSDEALFTFVMHCLSLQKDRQLIYPEDYVGTFLNKEVMYRIAQDITGMRQDNTLQSEYAFWELVSDNKEEWIFRSLKKSFREGEKATDAYQKLWKSKAYLYVQMFDNKEHLNIYYTGETETDEEVKNFLEDCLGITYEQYVNWQQEHEYEL